MVKRSYYSNDIQSFLNQDNYSIFGEITTNDQFSAEDLQKNTWNREIEILKRELSQFLDGYIIFEYSKNKSRFPNKKTTIYRSYRIFRLYSRLLF